MFTLKPSIGTSTMYFKGIIKGIDEKSLALVFIFPLHYVKIFFLFSSQDLFLTAQPNLLLKFDPAFALGALLNFYRIVSLSVFLASHCCNAVILRPENSPCP